MPDSLPAPGHRRSLHAATCVLVASPAPVAVVAIRHAIVIRPMIPAMRVTFVSNASAKARP